MCATGFSFTHLVPMVLAVVLGAGVVAGGVVVISTVVVMGSVVSSTVVFGSRNSVVIMVVISGLRRQFTVTKLINNTIINHSLVCVELSSALYRINGI